MSNVSVIIPNYNCSQWLPKVIDSCLIQKHLKEIIIVDDFSTDNSWDVLQNLQNKYPEIIKVYKNINKGGNNARNFGFEKSTGEYIQWLDADDFLLEGKFETQLRKFIENIDTDIVYSDWYMDFYENKTNFVKREKYKKTEYKDFTFEILKDNWNANNNYLLKRKIAQKLHELTAWNPNTKVAQDREYFTLAALNDAKFYYTPGYYSIYNIWNKNSVASTNFMKRLESQILLEKKFGKKIKDSNYSLKKKNKYNSVINSHLLNACFYNPKLTIPFPFSIFNVEWKIIHFKKYPFIPLIYIYQHLKYYFKKNGN